MRLRPFIVLAVIWTSAVIQAGPAREVDTLVGVVHNGHCMPGPCLPHASAYPSPDTLYPFKGRSYAPPAGLHYGDPVTGFSQLHTQGTGGTPSYGLFLLSPAVTDATTETDLASPLTFKETKCFRFAGRLEKPGVDVTVVPTAHGAFYQFDFPEGASPRLVLNIARKIGCPEALTEGSLTLDPDGRTMCGGGTYDKSWNPAPYQAYFAAVFDTAPVSGGTWQGTPARREGAFTASIASRGALGGWFRFDRRTIRVKIAVSFHSVERARAYLRKELSDWNSDRMAADAEHAWDAALSSVRIEGANAPQSRLFYSHLFHTFVQPRDRTNDFAEWPAGAAIWDDHYTMWDTWKTLFPLMAIVRPDVVAGNVNSFVSRFRKNGECSAAFIQGREYRVGQGGDDADNIIGDAWAKRIPGIDWTGAWEVLSANAARRTPHYREHGYVASDLRHDYCNRMKSGSGTLGFAYNDWCASRVAAGLGKKEESARLLARSASWTNVWDASCVDTNSSYAGFVRGRLASGAFGVPKKGKIVKSGPREGYNTDFYEGTPWIYSYVVPHDVPGMIARMGGRETFLARLRYALKNDLIDFGNEPSFMTIWLFNFVGETDDTSYWAHRLKGLFPSDGPPGDDDSGAMGSLYVFLTAGFFPFAGQDLYALHGPSVPKVVFTVPATGKTFTVEGIHAGGNNIYIKSVTLNGRPLTEPFIRHADILAGGVLRFEMTDKPRAQRSAGTAVFKTVIPPLPGEKWWGGVVNDGENMPYENTDKPRDLSSFNKGGATAPFLVSSAGRYVWSDRPFTYSAKNGTLTILSTVEKTEPVVAGKTLREAYLAACQKHFPFTGTTPAEQLFTKPQWNNWIEIAIQGMNQKSVDAYTEALAKSGFPCGVYMMDGGWFSHQGSYEFHTPDFPDPKGMFARIRAHGWKPMIWTAHFVSPDSREFKRLRYGRGYMIDGLDVLAYRKDGKKKTPGVVWWWSGISSVYDLTYEPGWSYFAKTLETFAREYGIAGFKFDAGDPGRLKADVRFHDSSKEAVDYTRAYVRLGAERFPYNEYRCGFRTGGWPVMQRLHDQGHTWKALANISHEIQAAGLLGSPYVVADMIGGGEATTFRPGGFFSEKLFLRSCALQALHPMMQFSAAPWRYLSKEGVQTCRSFADLHIAFGPYIMELARHASKTGEPIVRSMDYMFPGQGFNRAMTQFMLGSKWLVAPVVTEDDAVTVELPAGTWKDDLGVRHSGPKKIRREHVPVDRLPRFEFLADAAL